MIKSIIFDFDGVILESAQIKTKAFAEVVRDYPKDKADAFLAYHMTHMGISRHVKFRYFIEKILREVYSEAKENELANSFENIVYDQVMNCPFVPGAKEFLERNFFKYDFFIASGTPDDEMNRIVNDRGINMFFKEIYGSPLKKTEIINTILKKYGYRKDEILFVGDAETDLNASIEAKIGFIGRKTTENEGVFKEVEFLVDDLRGIEEIIEGRNRT